MTSVTASPVLRSFKESGRRHAAIKRKKKQRQYYSKLKEIWDCGDTQLGVEYITLSQISSHISWRADKRFKPLPPFSRESPANVGTTAAAHTHRRDILVPNPSLSG
jgi:hypothetical protein